VVKIEPLSRGPAAEKAHALGSHRWDLVVYFDRRLADSEAVGPTTVALAKVAGDLTGLGAVEVVVADSLRRELLAATREPDAVQGEPGSARRPAPADRLEKCRLQRGGAN
jgi:hypothetical protein